MEILSINGKINPAESKTNIVHKFTVPKGIKKLVVSYSYSPKEVEDQEVALKEIAYGLRKFNFDVANVSSFLPVRNLVTLSFDENGEYRGACHRHPNEQTILIAEKNSTNGINNSPIKSGEWDVVVNVHYVGCEVEYRIDIEGEETV